MAYDPDNCPKPKYPLQMTVVNSSRTRTVKEVDFDLEAYEDGRSDNLVSDGIYKKTTRVVRPGSTKKICWSLPTFKRSFSSAVSFRVNKEYVEFYDENDVIPPEPASTP